MKPDLTTAPSLSSTRPSPSPSGTRRPLTWVYRAILVVLSLSFLVLAAHLWREVDRESRSALRATTRQFVQMARAEFAHQEAMLRLLGSRLLDAGALQHPEQGRRLIEEMQRVNPALAGFGLARPDGQLVLVSGVPAGRTLPNLLQREASRQGFREALARRHMVIGRTYFFDLLQRWLIPVRLALREGDNRVVAVMAAGIDIDAPKALWNVVQTPPGICVTLVRDDGYVQLRSDAGSHTYAEIYDRPVAWRPKDGGDPLRGDVLSDQASLPRLGLTVVSSYERNHRLRVFRHRLATPLALFLGIVLISLFFYRSASRSQRTHELELVFHATHDALTGIPNRSLIQDRLEMEIAHAVRQKTRFAVIYLDLDNFKQINDSYGHEAGDRLLQAVAARLKEVLRDVDSLGRMGGDEFVILVSELARSRDAEVLTQRIQGAFREAFDLAGREYFVTASLGIAVYPDDAEEPATLLSHADTALYRAKSEGRDRVCFFEARYNQEIERRTRLEQGLRQALSRGEIHVLYQPKVDAVTGCWVGAEALMRWRSADLGEVSPVEFIPLAEESGLIRDLGNHVLEVALRDLQRIHEQAPGFQMAVNVSVRQFQDPDFMADVMCRIQETDTDTTLLELEVTESIMAQPLPVMELLLDMGLRLAIDDFGTGFSSLGVLKRLPVSTLKIDREFVRDIELDPADRALVTATIAVADALGLNVVAEGVETAGQADFLREQGCAQLQGYHFARPLPLQALLDGLRSGC